VRQQVLGYDVLGYDVLGYAKCSYRFDDVASP
jgi:hypothetical protein